MDDELVDCAVKLREYCKKCKQNGKCSADAYGCRFGFYDDDGNEACSLQQDVFGDYIDPFEWEFDW